MAMSDKGSVEYIDEKEGNEATRNVEANPAAALSAATEAQKASLVSPGMLRLWFIVGIGTKLTFIAKSSDTIEANV